MIILQLHFIAPFFPILFLFNSCFWVGYPLFLRYILKRKWFECIRNYSLKIKFILLPYFVMVTTLILWYYDEISKVLQQLAES